MIPDKTKFEEKTIMTKGDVIVGDRGMLQFGIKTDGRIFIGEHAIVDGDLDSTKDIRIDIFSNVGGNIKSGGNTYLGEKVKVKGRLSLKGDLDVGDSVEIEKGFEAKGWINIRSPIPVIIYIFIYLMQLLKLGRSEEIDRLLEELGENEGGTIPISETFMFIPNNSIMGMQKSRVDCNLRIGKECKILGNFDTKGNIYVDEETDVHGTLNSTGDVFCGKDVKIHGNISSAGNVHIGENTHIIGDVSGDTVTLYKTSTIGGKMFAKNGTSFVDSSKKKVKEKVKRLETDAAVVDEVDKMLE